MPPLVKPALAMDLLSQLDIRVGTIDSVTDVACSDKLVWCPGDFETDANNRRGVPRPYEGSDVEAGHVRPDTYKLAGTPY